ncbi:hypothetical protein V8G54_004788 [Vigna mungo]|uniref:Uncharacterized protein n=1 Tax=Vigna mungo TaxID=3915 RepID=A0AAQ3SBG6_VIGMU
MECNNVTTFFPFSHLQFHFDLVVDDFRKLLLEEATRKAGSEDNDYMKKVTESNIIMVGKSSRTNRAQDQAIFIAMETLNNKYSSPFLNNTLATAITVEARQEPHVPATLTNSTNLLLRQPLKQFSEKTIFGDLQHFLGATDVEALHEHSRRNHRFSLLPLQQPSQLLPEPAVHRHVTLADSNAQGLERRAHRVARLERFPHAAQRRRVDHHAVFPARGTYSLEPVRWRWSGFGGSEEVRVGVFFGKAEAFGVETGHEFP